MKEEEDESNIMDYQVFRGWMVQKLKKMVDSLVISTPNPDDSSHYISKCHVKVRL